VVNMTEPCHHSRMTRLAPDDVETERATRWWQARRPIGSIGRAAAFISDVGFALLFPHRTVPLPSLWAAASDLPVGLSAEDWSPEIQRVWGWKDELPLRRLAWYGRFIRGRPSFLSPALLTDLYARSGQPEDFEEEPLRDDARRVASVLLRSGPLPSAILRQAVNLQGKAGSARFSAALTELGRALVVTYFGTEQEGSGWPSAVLELTVRVFDIPPSRDIEEGRRRAATRFLQTMVAARPIDLAFAFGWTPVEARAVLSDLASGGIVIRDGTGFRTDDEERQPGPSERRTARNRTRSRSRIGT
jgi:hypothetical protein